MDTMRNRHAMATDRWVFALTFFMLAENNAVKQNDVEKRLCPCSGEEGWEKEIDIEIDIAG